MNSSGGTSADGSSGNSFRNIILGLPKEGPKPGSEDAEALHAAEAFLGDIRVEIEEFDRANARAVEAAAGRMRFWRRGFTAPSSVAVGTQTLPDGSVVERTSAARRADQYNRFMFKKRNPHSTPLLMRWWIPYACVFAIGLVWTPDTWKLRGLHYADSNYAALRRAIHTQYWRWTMDPTEFADLMKEIEANLPKNSRSVKSSDCPF
jgi:hypothetical protein